MLEGKLVRLRAFEQEDLDLNHAYANDSETMLRMYKGMPFPSSLADDQQWLNGQSSYTRGEYQFAIESLTDGFVGRCGITHMDWKNRCAELAMMIGAPHRRKGYGREALNLLSEFCFMQLNCHRLKVSVLDFNHAAIACYESCGFQAEGRLREEVYRNGRYCDVIILGKLYPNESEPTAHAD